METTVLFLKSLLNGRLEAKAEVRSMERQGNLKRLVIALVYLRPENDNFKLVSEDDDDDDINLSLRYYVIRFYSRKI